MKLLHTIRARNNVVYIWATVTGGGGRPLGNDITRAHIYPLERQPTPPRDGRDSSARLYFSPWGESLRNLTPEQKLTPVCGRIRTTSRLPRIGVLTHYDNWTPRCQNCAAIVENPQFYQYVARNDPWMLMREAHQYERNWWLAPDPVTGL